jgi:hypothetical protein
LKTVMGGFPNRRFFALDGNFHRLIILSPSRNARDSGAALSRVYAKISLGVFLKGFPCIERHLGSGFAAFRAARESQTN